MSGPIKLNIIYSIFTFVLFFEIYFSDCNMVAYVEEDYQEEYENVQFPEVNGNFKLVDILEPVDDSILSLDVRNLITFHLQTRKNPNESQIIQIGDKDSLITSNFKTDKTIVFLSHGWLSEAKDMNTIVYELLTDDDVNVINVDWSPIAKNRYITAKSMAIETGEVVGDFVNWLVNCGVTYDKVHLVGISLGAHMVGSAGRRTGGKVRRITALDPAGPLWYTDKKSLKSTDAQHVEVIHTNTLFFGYKYPCGDVDIYPNGGAIMPACQTSIAKNFCSHVMSMNFFIVSLRYSNHFVANQCSSYVEARNQICDGQPFVVGTSDLSKTGEGIYRMETEAKYPY